MDWSVMTQAGVAADKTIEVAILNGLNWANANTHTRVGQETIVKSILKQLRNYVAVSP